MTDVPRICSDYYNRVQSLRGIPPGVYDNSVIPPQNMLQALSISNKDRIWTKRTSINVFIGSGDQINATPIERL